LDCNCFNAASCCDVGPERALVEAGAAVFELADWVAAALVDVRAGASAKTTGEPDVTDDTIGFS
jgi:hypothetical protein